MVVSNANAQFVCSLTCRIACQLSGWRCGVKEKLRGVIENNIHELFLEQVSVSVGLVSIGGKL